MLNSHKTEKEDMASTEEDFPRGGAVKKARGNNIDLQVEVDNLFESNEKEEFEQWMGGIKDKKFKKQKTAVAKGDGLTLNADAECVEILHSKDVKEGMLMLGCVKDVSDFEVTVGLPCGLQGFLSIRNICDSYTKLLTEQLDSTDEDICALSHLFYTGMMLRCVVAKLDTTRGGKMSIQLSVNPKLVNSALTSSALKADMVLSGCVESLEDHGCIVDIGVNGTKAFLPKKADKDKQNSINELKVGQYLTCQIKEVKNDGRVLRLCAKSLAVGRALAESKQGWTLTNLLPGLLVKATVRKVTRNGLLMDFLSSFRGQVDILHMEQEMATHYNKGSNMLARVLYLEPSTRLVGLSLRDHIVQPETRMNTIPACGDRVGEVVKDCKIASMHVMSGAVLELPDKTLAFVHRNNLKELNEPANENKVLALPKHTCRIIDFSPIDQIHFATLRKTVIERTFFRYSDLQAGQIVEGTVSVLLNRGMVVHLSSHIRGLVPSTHLSGIVLKNPEKKYAKGMKVKCRVLSVDVDNKKLYLTRKKALIESSLPLFLSYDDARPGRVSHGYIVSVKNFGCVVRFYNNVKGLVPVNELSSEVIVNPEDVFYVGQVLRARVLQCDPEKEKMMLSFKPAAEGDTEEMGKAQFGCERLEAKVLKKSVNGLEVSITPNGVPALLPTMHLSDLVSNCSLLWEALQEGDTISNLVCFLQNKNKIAVTKKPMVIWSLEEGVAAKEFSEITVGMQMFGWVKNIMAYGVFVEFPYGLIGLAPKSAMSDKFIADTTTTFHVGQTVVAKVTNLDEEKKRFLVTLKISEVTLPEGSAQTRLIHAVQERRAATEMIALKAGDLYQQLAALSVGQRLKLAVDTVKDGDGSTFKSDELVGATIRANKYHLIGIQLTPGQKVTAVVIYVDILSATVHVSLLSKLVTKKKTLSEESKYSAILQHIDKDLAIISVEDTAQLTFIQTQSHLNEVILPESVKLREGMLLTVEVVEPSCEQLQGLPLLSWKRAAPKRLRTVSENQMDSDTGYRFGEIVQGKVRTVKPTNIQVELEDGSTGFVHVSEVMEATEVSQGSFPTSFVKVGSVVTGRVIGRREVNSNGLLPISQPRLTYTSPELTLIPSKLDRKMELKSVTAAEKLSSYKVGEEITCFVSKFHPERKSLEVTSDLSITGTVELLAMITDLKDSSRLEKLYKLGQAVKAKVVEMSLKPQRFLLSLTGIHELQTGSITLGMVTSILPHLGLVVKLPFGCTGTVAITDLADAYKPNPLAAFSKDQLLRCYLLGFENDKWHLSLRPSRLNPQQAKPAKDTEVFSLKDLQQGQLIRGFVKSISEQGVFIRLSNSITGRAELQRSTKYFVNNHKVLCNHLPPSTLLTTKIISINRKEKLVELSLLTVDTGKPDILPESLHLPLRLVGQEKKKYNLEKKKKRSLSESEEKNNETEPPKKKTKKKKKTNLVDNDSGVDVYFREEEDQEAKDTNPVAVNVSSSSGPFRLQVAAGFSWDLGLSSLKPATANMHADSSDGEDQDEHNSKSQKKSRYELEQEKKVAEKALTQREMELMDPQLRPQDAAAFERLLLASPNSSILWLQYMAHHLQATQIEQARAVAERALKTISFREEQEKLNVWVALLNLENMYGTQESLKKVFERALQFCEPMPVYQQLADIYSKSDKMKEAENLYKSMVKRFRQNKAVWLSYGTFLLQHGQNDAASALLQRALKSLPSKESVDVITKFAQLEFRFGNTEKGRTMFDKILTSYPKRTDLWSIFIDLMVKHGSQKEVRAIFDRVIHLSVSVKKIKFFFKRYLEYEKKHGTPQSIQAVKEKAVEFVEGKGSEAAS
ncbi:protein RRP5 homolog isoform X2 [Hippocampus comes]|uniref:protein RRP5 homolog isoform X2 n=1 Tax=Hippocampus comes TaxID=109280 RepID=UPI00094F2D6E|nr:PREDICTED: protein RRP5 homolog isoform X2 [Hippocampus comes]